MKKRIPWGRVCLGIVIAAVLCQLWLEFDVAFLFLAGTFGVGAAWVLIKARWEAGREQKNWETQAFLKEGARLEAVERRRETCRKVRYHREEQAQIEDHIQRTLGPVETWDLERGEEPLCLDAALIPPTESLPYWKAATMGAGAYTMEAGGDAVRLFRMELVMALPPDWAPSDRWAVQVLRDAVRRFLVVEGLVGCGSVYRGFSLINAGFAGAVVAEGVPGLPDLGFAAMPGAPPVRFFWLVPLLKPELDYLQQRGLGSLKRRFPAESPWADRTRNPLAESQTWFQEDIAPFAWSEDNGLFCLGLEIGEWRRELFSQAGYSNLAWGWEDLARRYLRRRQPDDEPFVEFACEEGLFFAASRDEEIMRKLALGLSDLLRDSPQEARQMLY